MLTAYNETTKPSQAGQQESEQNTISSKRFMKIEVERFRKHWVDFCNVTSIHGVRYLVAFERPLFERLWWASVFATCLYYATVYAYALWSRWLVSPIENTSVIKYESIVNIPLPAITFCNNMKATAETKYENALLFICGLDTTESQNGTLIIEEMIEMAPPFDCTCTFLHQHKGVIDDSYTDCRKMFTRSITQDGICYSFNMMNSEEVFRQGVINHFLANNRSSDWHPDTGYNKDAKLADRNGTNDPFFEGTYPKRAISMPYINISLDSVFNGSFCPNETPGVKVVVHSPHEMPVINNRQIGWTLMNEEDPKKGQCFTCLKSDYEYAMEVDPELTWASSSLKIFKPHQRKCYYNDERYLSFFHYYTQTNCENECLVNHTLKICGCVDFYMPRFESTKVCDLINVTCIIDSMDWWKRRGRKECQCYPSCSEIKYKTYLWGKNKTAGARNNNSRVLSVTIYLPDSLYLSRENKQSQWTIVDLFASCGGVFGLFCGMSIIGVVEFLYYTTIRAVSNFLRLRRRQKVASESTG